MKTAKSPSMPFYGKDIFTDVRTQLLPWAAQYLYIRLLWWQWQEGSVPDDERMIAAVLGREREARKFWPLVRPFFAVVDDIPGHLQNGKLEEIRASMVALREKRAGAGSKGGSKPQAKETAIGEANREAKPPPAVAVASVVASSVPKEPKELTFSESGGSGGNGNGRNDDGRHFQPLWTERAFQYKCDKIAQWVAESTSRGVIPETEDFGIEFTAKWGMSYDRWMEQQPLHEAYFARTRT